MIHKEKPPLKPEQVRWRLPRPKDVECRLSADREGVVVRPLDTLAAGRRLEVAEEACVVLAAAGLDVVRLFGAQLMVRQGRAGGEP